MAHNVFQRSVTAGVALAGATAITFASAPLIAADDARGAAEIAAEVAPVSTPRTVTTNVEYVALIRSLELLLSGAVESIGDSVGAFTNEMPAVIDYIGIGVPGALWEDPDYLPLSHSLFAVALLTPVAPLAVGPFSDAVVDVVADAFPGHSEAIRENLTEAIDYAFARLVGPIVSAMGATGAVHQQFYAAGMAGDRIGQIVALLSAPGPVIDGFLNGGYGDLSPLITGEIGGEDRIVPPGLLTPWGQYPEDRSVTDKFPDVETEEPGEEVAATVQRAAVVDDTDVSDGADASDDATETDESDTKDKAPAAGDSSESAKDDAEKDDATPTKVKGAKTEKADKSAKADTADTEAADTDKDDAGDSGDDAE